VILVNQVCHLNLSVPLQVGKLQYVSTQLPLFEKVVSMSVGNNENKRAVPYALLSKEYRVKEAADVFCLIPVECPVEVLLCPQMR
jgi:hypothetical protein